MENAIPLEIGYMNVIPKCLDTTGKYIQMNITPKCLDTTGKYIQMNITPKCLDTT